MLPPHLPALSIRALAVAAPPPLISLPRPLHFLLLYCYVLLRAALSLAACTSLLSFAARLPAVCFSLSSFCSRVLLAFPARYISPPFFFPPNHLDFINKHNM